MGVQAQLSEIDGGSCELAPSMFHVLERTLSQRQDELAVIVTTQDASHLARLAGKSNESEASCLSWTFDELHHASLQIINSLQRQYSLRPGSTIVTLAPNGIEYALTLWFSMVGKYTYCPLDVNLLAPSNADELKSMLGKIQPDVVIVADGQAASIVDVQLSHSPQAKLA